VRHGGFLRDAELFEHGFFSMSAAEASAMDPQQRQLLERGYGTFHEAGMAKDSLLGSITAANVGQWASEFGNVLMRAPAGRSVYASTGFSCSVTCGRVSFVLGLQGPCASYDTACSASLVAHHGSMRALQCLECELALSAGVNMILDPAAIRGNAVAGFTSVRGRSHTFDVRADGYARGEAVDAIACRLGEEDVVVGMLGSAVRQDGRSASLTAPNGQAQQGVLMASAADARLGANQVRALEAHGTGTALGDPIEAGAVAAVFLAPRSMDPLVVGSLKANAGHTEPGAGLAGSLKLVTQLCDDGMSPNAQLRALNPHVGASLRSHAACQLPSQPVALRMLKGGEFGSGGVSSFGYAGTIAHALLRQAGGDGGAAAALLPLVCRRRSFPWRDPPHPFVQQLTRSSDGANVFRSPAAGALHALVANHVVQGRLIFPGAGYLEVARAAGATALHGVYFLQPLAAEASRLLIECAVSNARFEVRTSETEAFEDATVHCSGATATDTTVWQRVEHASVRTLSCAVDVGALYDGFDAVGLQYGPGYRTLVNAWGSASDALARLRARSTYDGTQVLPADLDDALCTSAAMASSGGGETRLPFAVDDALLQGAPGELWAVRSRNLRALPTAPYA
jgi:acyl transferase domain-containing protein